jgi:hypothetical protein
MKKISVVKLGVPTNIRTEHLPDTVRSVTASANFLCIFSYILEHIVMLLLSVRSQTEWLTQ